MGYIYDTLKGAIGGSSSRKGVIRDWSPNEIRAIFIMRNYIYISYFVKAPKIVNMDINEVTSELHSGHFSGNLNNLLENRQLSCMEEIYVDNYFAPYKGLIDLTAYYSSAYNQASRLRDLGYCNPLDVSKLDTLYRRVLVEGTFDFRICMALALRKDEIFWDTENAEWYNKFNLRPQYYYLDGDNGKLAIYFKKCRDAVVQGEAQRVSQELAQSEKKQVLDALKVDRSNGSNIGILNTIIRLSSKSEGFFKAIGDAVNKYMASKIKVEGLTKEKFISYLDGNNVNDILSFYESVKLFSDNDGAVNIGSSIGLYGLSRRLDLALRDIFLGCSSDLILRWVYLAIKRVGSFPDGEALRALKFKLPKLDIAIAPKERASDVFVDIILSLCGYTRSDIIRYMSNRRSSNV